MSMLFTWALAAAATLAPQRTHDRLATAITSRVEAEAPLFKGDDDRKRTTALLVAMAFRESSLREDAVGDHVAGRPTSFCAFQIHLPFGAKSAEGWTGEELASDPSKCVATAMRLLRASMRACPKHPLAWYAAGPSGCESERAQRISRDRLALAQRLLRDVKEPSEGSGAETPAGAKPPVSDESRKTTMRIGPAVPGPRRFAPEAQRFVSDHTPSSAPAAFPS
ncbi:MAG: hypothetical protein JST00_12270 [Deltaproteobacteria bacterium]|nr:hypothetical protein [Deltaproteobacteria bacterium]